MVLTTEPSKSMSSWLSEFCRKDFRLALISSKFKLPNCIGVLAILRSFYREL